MGRRRAEEISGLVTDGTIPLETALLYHLQQNHYPPVHADFIPSAVRAIEACSRSEYNEVILMPNGLRRTAAQIVEGLHLEEFIEREED